MAKKTVALMLLVSMVCVLACHPATATTITKQDGVSATASKLITPSSLLDDFSKATTVNTWNCLTGAYGTDASCTASYVDDDPAGGTGKSLQLTYNVSTLGSYAGYYSSLGSQSISGYTTISFYVKGAVGGEFFKVELKNTGTNANTNAAAVYITDYLDGGVTLGWQKVTIPLHAFANISDWTSAKEFCITFENSQSTKNESATSGTIYIDNIAFGNPVVNAVRINYFGNMLGRCALGGNMGGGMPNEYPTISWARLSFSSTYYHASSYGAVSEYNVSNGQWAGHYLIFGGGSGGSTAIPHNFSAFRYITFYVKAKTSAKNPKIIRMEVIDSVGTKSYLISGITSTAWLPVNIDLNSADINGSYPTKASIKQINFIYEYNRIHDAGGQYSGTGTVYIDDIQFSTTTVL